MNIFINFILLILIALEILLNQTLKIIWKKLKIAILTKQCFFVRRFLSRLKDPRPIYVNCNDVGTILNESLKVAGDIKYSSMFIISRTLTFILI